MSLFACVGYERNRPSVDPKFHISLKWDQVLVCRHPITGSDCDVLTLHIPHSKQKKPQWTSAP